ncbi:MAG: hypothetical protein KDB04_19195 [Acidimicrobiales bacterium]|nr:hypothetical protein [Acidimicrobiales bacterium]HRW38554.1 hypothetical protein [Aquihabitans sp.]
MRRDRTLGCLLAAGALVLAACSGGEGGGGSERGATTAASTSSAASRPATGVEVAWATTMTGPTREDEIDGVAAADDGSVWVTGKFERSTTLGGEELTSAGAADIPLARFDRDGAPAFVRSFGGAGEDNLFDIDAGPEGAVGTGWFEGTVAFDDVQLTSAGSADCVVVSFDDDGVVRWATSFGGPGPDGCNEVVVSDDGTVTTSLDTAGGWSSPAGDLGTDAGREVVLVQLDADGELRWAGLVSGPGAQRGKSLAVADDGSVALGGDTTGDVAAGDLRAARPGRRTDAWVSIWSADGEPEGLAAWGGSGDDLAKGLAFGGDGVWAVGQFEGAVEVGDDRVDAGEAADLAVVRVALDGTPSLVGTVSAKLPLAGAEVTAAADGGVLFGTPNQPGTALVTVDGVRRPLEGDGAAALVWWSPDGSVRGWTLPGKATLGADEIARVDDRVYLDIVIRGDGNVAAGVPLTADAKDASVWAVDLVAA